MSIKKHAHRISGTHTGYNKAGASLKLQSRRLTCLVDFQDKTSSQPKPEQQIPGTSIVLSPGVRRIIPTPSNVDMGKDSPVQSASASTDVLLEIPTMIDKSTRRRSAHGRPARKPLQVSGSQKRAPGDFDVLDEIHNMVCLSSVRRAGKSQ
ncbi:hypothetical protein OBBRIDRAFT_889356 [Obba rivulosa]|uniref:Uncharacterized protein n=1 Tax=Obba rivulosa TaxID=1052685 RepID=A0A8E2AU48_9APHY|nr:hypothetical protein OBBRIDRAFT_889356 [Obba rivulosa]